MNSSLFQINRENENTFYYIYIFREIAFPHYPTTSDYFNIAFYAYMTGRTPSITIQHPLVFDVVKTNDGNGYHATTGTFIAPETGLYVFTWTIRENGDCYHSTQLMVNSGEEGEIFLRSVSGGDFIGTGVGVTHVNTGDDVYVRTHQY